MSVPCLMAIFPLPRCRSTSNLCSGKPTPPTVTITAPCRVTPPTPPCCPPTTRPSPPSPKVRMRGPLPRAPGGRGTSLPGAWSKGLTISCSSPRTRAPALQSLQVAAVEATTLQRLQISTSPPPPLTSITANSSTPPPPIPRPPATTGPTTGTTTPPHPPPCPLYPPPLPDLPVFPVRRGMAGAPSKLFSVLKCNGQQNYFTSMLFCLNPFGGRVNIRSIFVNIRSSEYSMIAVNVCCD